MPRFNVGWRSGITGAAMALTALVGACARQSAPPGGPEDRRPPVVVATTPDTFARVDELDGSVVFKFDERISERPSSGTIDQAVLVSPRTGKVHVSTGRDEVKVSVEGGYKPGVVYRVRLLPVIKDMFGNRLRAPFELVFSTGGELTPSAVAGMAWDRTTGQGVEDLKVTAVGTDSTVYVSRTDSGGIYAFRYLPPDVYQLHAYNDRNRNDSIDAMEVQGMAPLSIQGPDTILELNVPVLQPDTLPAKLASATLLDSMTLALNFDHWLPSTRSADSVHIRILPQEPDTTKPEADTVVYGPVPPIAQVYNETEYRMRVEAVADSFARIDSIKAAADAAKAAAIRAATLADTAAEVQDSTVRDTAQAAGERAEPDSAQAADSAQVVDSTKAPPRRSAQVAQPPKHPFWPDLPAGQGQGSARSTTRLGSGPVYTAPDSTLLPGRRIVVRLSSAIPPGKYHVIASNVETLNGLGDGGGDVAFERVPPPPPDTTAEADSTGVEGAAVPGDTVPPPDTVAVGRDVSLDPFDGPWTPPVPPDAREPERLPFLPGRGR